MKEIIDIDETLELANICKSVYSSIFNHKKLKYKGNAILSQKIVHGSYGRGFCRILWNENHLIFAFRGTREGVDWLISNLKMLPKTLKIEKRFSEKEIFVHSGFQNTLLFRDKTTQLVSTDAIFKHIIDNDLMKNREVVITGHSLGGALGILFFIKLDSRFKEYFQNNKTRIIIFGCPATGLKRFKSYFNSLNQETIRIINQSDGVPFMPPFLYRHIGYEVWMDGNNLKFNSNWKKRLKFVINKPLVNLYKNHLIENYIKTILKIKSSII